MNKTALYVIIAVIVAGGAGFFGGMATGKSQVTAARGQFAAGQFGGTGGTRTGTGRGGTAGNFIAGQILSADATGITVKIQTGGSKIVFISASTTILKSAEGTQADLTTGQNVMVTGTTNSDGSVTATSIQIRNGMPGMVQGSTTVQMAQ